MPGSLVSTRPILARARRPGEVRRAGHAVENGEITPGSASVASAVRGHAGHPVASVALTYPQHEVSGRSAATLGEHVMRTAQMVSRRLGA